MHNALYPVCEFVLPIQWTLHTSIYTLQLPALDIIIVMINFLSSHQNVEYLQVLRTYFIGF